MPYSTKKFATVEVSISVGADHERSICPLMLERDAVRPTTDPRVTPATTELDAPDAPVYALPEAVA